MIFADNAATTRVSDAALSAMLPFLKEDYGNPSSAYSFGRRAADALYEARRTVALHIGADPKEIYFTSGGSEADNQAILSAATAGKRRGKTHLITSAFEHHAVLHTMKKLERDGFEVTCLNVNRDGVIRPEDVKAAIRDDTALVSVMFVNNEVGTVQPVREIGAICREAGVPFHTDAVQAAGHMPIDVKAMNIDMLSMSGHKFHAPKGVGVLYASRSMPLYSLVEGGGQERGKRAGTENVAGIAALAAAFDESCREMSADTDKITRMRDMLMEGISSIPHCVINGSPEHRCPGTVSVCFEGIQGEALLLALDREGICASAGSACTSGSSDPSHVLTAMGIPQELAVGALRLSLGKYNTPEEAERILEVLPAAVAELRSQSPLWWELESGRRPHII